MRLRPDASDVIASLDGAHVAAAGERLRLFDVATRAEVRSAALEGPSEIAILGADRLLAVAPGNGRTLLCGFALPSLELLAQIELEGRLRLLAVAAGRALVATESLEQPRVVAITSKILVEPIPLREPLLLAAGAPEERLLVASRTREAQLECWDPLLRRALFRLNLPLMARAQQAGFAARRRLLWIASESGQLEVYRFSDGRLQARLELGAPLAGAAGHPESPRVVFATRVRGGDGVELTEIDFQQGERRELTPPVMPETFCVVEGAAPALVLVAGDALTWMALPPAMPGEVARASAPAATAAAATARKSTPSRGASPEDWRARLAGGAAPAATATRAEPAAATDSAAAESAAAESAAAESAAGAPASVDGRWRDRLCDWAETVLSASRRAPALPAWPGSTVASLAERLALDARATRALALVYGARLLGQGDGVAAVVVARALVDGDGDGGHEAAWQEALGLGLLGQLGVARARAGRLRLTAAAGRFLDGAAPRVTLLPGGAGVAELPRGNVRVDGGAEPLAAIGARLAERHGYDVALVRAETRSQLLAQLAEARMHGAWPVVDGGKDPQSWIDGLDEGPTAVVIRGEAPAKLAAWPRL